MKTVVLTGSKGFVGRNLLQKLNEDEKYIIIEINEDIFDSDQWDLDLLSVLVNNRPDVIFHVGACSDTLEKDVNYMMKLNYEFTKILVDWSKDNDCKLIYSSSAASYGINGQYPSNLYGWSKYVAEQYVISNNGIALRYFNVYGPGEEEKGNMASLALQSFIKFNKGEECKLFLGKPKRDFVYVKDIVSANLHAVKKYSKLNKKYYDVGSGEARLFEDILTILKIPFTYYSEEKIPQGYQFYTCSDKKKWMKGWEPEYIIENGLKDYKKYLRKLLDK